MITYSKDISQVRQDQLEHLYGDAPDICSVFEKSYLKAFAFHDGKLIGAVRILSEGVETALMVDYRLLAEYTPSIGRELIQFLEEDLADRRVMVFGSRKDLGLFESLGYGRCKNAWTFYRDGFDELDYLPEGYRYENEFLKEDHRVHSERLDRDTINIEYILDPVITDYDEVNDLLTKAFFGKPHDTEKTAKAFGNSQYVIAAYEGDKLTGIARAVSDNSRFATILNVAVDPEYQGLNIGRNLVVRLAKQIHAEIVVLNTHPGAVGFYNRLTEFRRNKYVFEKHIRSEPGEEMPREFAVAMFTPKGYRFPDEYPVW